MMHRKNHHYWWRY